MKNEVLMPRLGVNDDFVILTKWLVSDGVGVKKGQKIAEIETSKETSEIKAEADGFLYHNVQANEDVKVGAIIAYVTDEEPAVSESSVKVPELKITAKAKAIAEEYNIDLSVFPPDKLIKEKDVLRLISKPYEIAETKSNKVIIYGGGGLAKVVIDILRGRKEYQLYGVIDSNYPEKKEVFGVPVIGNDEMLEAILKDGYNKAFNAIGLVNNAHWRKPPYEKLKKMGFEFINVIHDTAAIEESVRMGEGNLVCAGAAIGSDAIIGNNCFINVGSIISHDCIISDNCHIASGAVLAGRVIVGENTLIGQGCTIYIGVKIGKNVVIQNGCHVFKNVPDGTVVTLNSAK